MSNNPHEGHRKRLKREFLEQDFPDSVPVHKVLETLLFYGVPRKDTNVIAHELLEKFGSISGVLEAAPQDLYEVKGMTENAVSLIKLILPLSRRYNTEKYDNAQYTFTSTDQIGEYLLKKYEGYREEVFMVATFKPNGSLIACDVISKGDMTMVPLTIKAIVQNALKHSASHIVVSHNHVSGTALPSQDDIYMTQRLNQVLKELNIKLMDHIIICEDDFISLFSSKDYRSILL